MSTPIIKLTPHALWPQPGVYAGIPAEKYHALKACSSTMLKALARMNPAKALHHCQNFKETPDIIEGRILHTFLHEPADFSKLYPIALPCGALLASGDRKGLECGKAADLTEGGWRCGVHSKGVKIIGSGITMEFYDRLTAARAEVYRVAGAMFAGIEEGLTLPELSLVWIDPQTELLCKARLDLYQPVEKAIWDPKKVRSATAESFGAVCSELRYDIQQAWYKRGSWACFGPGDYEFHFVAVELEEGEKNGAQVLTLDRESRECGEDTMQACFELYAECVKTGIWPGYSPTPKLVTLRPWILRNERM